MQKLSVQNVTLEKLSKAEIQQGLGGIDPEAYEGLELFRGVAVSSSLNSHSLRLDTKALRQVKDAFNTSIGVFTNHDTDATNRVGKTLKSNIRDGKVYVDFGIQPGIEVSHTDDLIRIMSTLGSELSITFFSGDNGLTCDVCSSAFVPYYGGYVWMCENQHILGHMVGDDAQRGRVTGTVENIERVSELSIVGNGSDPNTEVIKQIIETREISAGMMSTMAELNHLNIENLSYQLSLQTPKAGSKVLPIEPSPTKKEALTMSDPTKVLEMSHEDLTQQLTSKSKECENLKTQMETMKTEEDYQTLAVTIAELRQEIADKDVKIAALEPLETAIESEIEHWYHLACAAKKQQMNYKDDDPRFITYCEELSHIKDVKSLRVQATTNSAAYAAERLEVSKMRLPSDPDAPTLGSGHTN